MNKIKSNLIEVMSGIQDGSSVMIGGFGGAGAPIELIHALIASGAKNLTIINNNAGNGHVGLASLIEHKRVSKIICSFPRSSDPKVFNEQYLAGEIELEIVPQGTLAERIRAGGAGIPAFYTPTGVGTEVAKGKVETEFYGKRYIQESWLKADYALIKAESVDPHGNLTYRRAARNFNPLMAMAAAHTIVQASNVVSLGDLDPDHIITPGIFIDSVFEIKEPAQEEVLNRSGVVYPC